MSRGRPAVLAAVIATSLAAAGCLTASQESRLQTDMSQVRDQVFEMQKDTAAVLMRLEAIEDGLASQRDASPTHFADLESLLRSLTDEVRALGARMDDNTSRMTALSRDVTAAREQYRALEARLAASLATGARPTTRPLPGAGGGGEPPEEPGPDTYGVAGGPPGEPVNLPDPSAPLSGGEADPNPPLTPAPVPSAATAAEGPADEAAQEQAYRAAYNDYTRGSFDSALSGFQEFQRQFPSSPLAGRAQYYIGESLFSQQRYDESAAAFTLTIENYPGSDKAAAAYLKKGLSLLALKQTARGVIQLQHVIETYPRTEEARVAADRLRQLGLRDH